MKTMPQNWAGLFLAVVVVVAIALAIGKAQPVATVAGPVSPRYQVVATDGGHLIVTDNQSNTIYYYSIDKEAQIGSELKLRGSADLRDVGKPIIKPVLAK